MFRGIISQNDMRREHEERTLGLMGNIFKYQGSKMKIFLY